ncbi:hypothetical protein TYRP_023305 [Tyrophagus putrescentiae]|nr:hypothetical protein TYRP_023305 [Tyrophagus putrescentiae]
MSGRSHENDEAARREQLVGVAILPTPLAQCTSPAASGRLLPLWRLPSGTNQKSPFWSEKAAIYGRYGQLQMAQSTSTGKKKYHPSYEGQTSPSRGFQVIDDQVCQRTGPPLCREVLQTASEFPQPLHTGGHWSNMPIKVDSGALRRSEEDQSTSAGVEVSQVGGKMAALLASLGAIKGAGHGFTTATTVKSSTQRCRVARTPVYGRPSALHMGFTILVNVALPWCSARFESLTRLTRSGRDECEIVFSFHGFHCEIHPVGTLGGRGKPFYGLRHICRQKGERFWHGRFYGSAPRWVTSYIEYVPVTGPASRVHVIGTRKARENQGPAFTRQLPLTKNPRRPGLELPARPSADLGVDTSGAHHHLHRNVMHLTSSQLERFQKSDHGDGFNLATYGNTYPPEYNIRAISHPNVIPKPNLAFASFSRFDTVLRWQNDVYEWSRDHRPTQVADLTVT